MPLQTESVIENRVVRKLRENGCLVTKLCNVSGWPDRMVLKDGRTAFLEIKDPKGRVSAIQDCVHEMLRAHGFSVFVVRDSDHGTICQILEALRTGLEKGSEV